MKNKNLLTDHFLIAMPGLMDANFSQAVVYLFEHSDQGALGVVINKPLQINLGAVLEHLESAPHTTQIAECPVYMGGPVAQEHGFIIYIEPSEKKTKKQPEIIISASKDMLLEIAEGKGPEQFIITLGYSGWAPGQLEKEISRNDWLVAPLDANILFNTPVERRWKAAASLIGVDFNKLSDQVGHA